MSRQQFKDGSISGILVDGHFFTYPPKKKKKKKKKKPAVFYSSLCSTNAKVKECINDIYYRMRGIAGFLSLQCPRRLFLMNIED